MKAVRIEFAANRCRLILADGTEVDHPYEVLTTALQAVEGAPGPRPRELARLRDLVEEQAACLETYSKTDAELARLRAEVEGLKKELAGKRRALRKLARWIGSFNYPPSAMCKKCDLRHGEWGCADVTRIDCWAAWACGKEVMGDA